MRIRLVAVAAAFAIVLVGMNTGALRAEDTIEKAGVGVGVTAGNMIFLPLKASSMFIGALAGALSWVVTGGNTDLTQQIWRDTSEGPYIITPDVARTAVGQRPERHRPKAARTRAGFAEHAAGGPARAKHPAPRHARPSG